MIGTPITKVYKLERDLRQQWFLPFLRKEGFAEYLETPFEKGRADVIFFQESRLFVFELKLDSKPRIKPPKIEKVKAAPTPLQLRYLEAAGKYDKVYPAVLYFWYENVLPKPILQCAGHAINSGDDFLWLPTEQENTKVLQFHCR